MKKIMSQNEVGNKNTIPKQVWGFAPTPVLAWLPRVFYSLKHKLSLLKLREFFLLPKVGNKNTIPKQVWGFALLYAVLMVSIVLAVTLGLLNIAYRQTVLTAIARDSLVAQAAAETGLGCALYHNAASASNASNTDSPDDKEPFGRYYQSSDEASWIFIPATPNQPINCLENSSTINVVSPTPNPGSENPPWQTSGDFESYRSNFAILFSNDSCAEVQVTKYIEASPDQTLDPASQTSIVVGGYSFATGTNTADGTCEITGRRVVQRTLRARVNH